MEIIVIPIREGILYHNDLYEWARSFDDDPDDPDFDALSYLDGDPDILRCDGNKLYFMAVVINGKRYVLTHDQLSDIEREMLTRFYQDDFRRYFEELPCDWAAFDAADRVIAYRGGKGYLYTIWNYTARSTAEYRFTTIQPQNSKP